MAKCRSCGKEYRKGTLVMLLDAESNSGGRHTRVCAGCARGGMLLVAPRAAASAKRDPERLEQPLVEKVAAAIRQLRGYARMAEKAARDNQDQYNRGWHGGRAEAFDGAVELLKGLK